MIRGVGILHDKHISRSGDDRARTSYRSEYVYDPFLKIGKLLGGQPVTAYIVEHITGYERELQTVKISADCLVYLRDHHDRGDQIRDDIRNADLAIIDQETIFETDKKNFIKKVTNTPTELGDAIAKAGFKLVLHGTLYAFSKEEKGIKNTINFWKNKYPDIKILGINEDEKSINDDYYIFSKNGIKIGIVNFYGHGKKMIPENKQFYVNIMRKEKIKELLGKLSTETDFVIVCVNWGTKNSKEPTKKQMKWAKEFAANGAKLIIGHHSSFVQQVSSVKSKGKRALVFWSLGHLINDNKRKYSILGAMANITISKSDDGAYISEYNLIPTINHKDKGKHYSIYKLSQYSNELFKISNVNHTKFSRKDIVKKCNFLMGGLADCF